MTEIGHTCRGCAGSGISASASPREAQIAQTTIYLTKRWNSTYKPPRGAPRPQIGQVRAKAKITERPLRTPPWSTYSDSRDPRSALPAGQRDVHAHARVDAWEGVGGVHKSRLAMSGPLGHVIEHLRKRIDDGYTIDDGSVSIPELERLRCEWCAGLGVAGAVLTAHTMQEAIAMKEEDR